MCAGDDKALSKLLSDHDEWDHAVASQGPVRMIDLHDEHAHHGETETALIIFMGDIAYGKTNSLFVSLLDLKTVSFLHCINSSRELRISVCCCCVLFTQQN